MRPEMEREAREWLSYAEMDMEAARALIPMVRSLAPVVAFHSQQAAEKALKGLLTLRGVTFPRSHDLEALVALCGADAADADSFATAAKTLTPYAVQARYPGYFSEATEKQAEEAVRLASEIVQYVRRQLQEPPSL